METVRINFNWEKLKNLNFQNSQNLNILWGQLINIDIEKYTEEILNIKGKKNHDILLNENMYTQIVDISKNLEITNKNNLYRISEIKH